MRAIFLSSHFLYVGTLVFLLFAWTPCRAQAFGLNGQWYAAPNNCTLSSTPRCTGIEPVNRLDRTGGRFFWQGEFTLVQPTDLVLDFKNSSTIGLFHERIFDARGHVIAQAEGGIQSAAPNPFFLRHGREFTLQPGHYRLTIDLVSPFLLAQPMPYLDTLRHYQQAIKPGDALTLLSMGVLLGLMFYYIILSAIRRNATDGTYALFILGNLLYNGTALLVFRELFDWHWFYLVSFPILFSNAIYILFVLRLLNITHETNPWLHRVGIMLLGLFAGFVLLALWKPHWSLEIDRIGVGLFLSYGLSAGIVRSRQGHFSAPTYLIAVLIFFALGVLSISLNKLTGTNTIYIEHLGLLAVTVEVLLLALVLARQFSQLRTQFERASIHATQDMLTGLKNRRGFFETGIAEVERSKRNKHPLSIIFLDLDNFKQLNDSRGHDIGDAALRATANALRANLRANDLLARLGGDEFAILLPEVSHDIAAEAGQKICVAVNAALRDFLPVTASIGVIRFTHVTQTFSAIMKIADELMYEVKRNGKNDVYFRQID